MSTHDVIDLGNDDVEGHGLREVAAGIGAAAVLAGGGVAGAVTAATSDLSVHPSGLSTPVATAAQTAEAAVEQGKAQALDTAKADRATVKAIERYLLPRIDEGVRDAEAKPGPAGRPVTNDVTDEVRKVATVLSVVTVPAQHGVRTAKALLTPVLPGTREVTGWILVKAGDTVLAQVHVKDGQALATWTTPLHAASVPVVVTYTGDDLYAPAIRALDL